MTDMNIDWARELLREAAGIYLAHLYEGGDMDALTDAFIGGGIQGVNRALNIDVPVLSVRDGGLVLEDAWPNMPDLNGRDMFPAHPVVGMTDADVFDLARAELARARAKYPHWPADLVHAAAIASEESGEVVKAVNSYHWQQGDATLEDIRAEAVQAIAMWTRFLTEMV